jgi:hypothetical protein
VPSRQRAVAPGGAEAPGDDATPRSARRSTAPRSESRLTAEEYGPGWRSERPYTLTPTRPEQNVMPTAAGLQDDLFRHASRGEEVCSGSLQNTQRRSNRYREGKSDLSPSSQSVTKRRNEAQADTAGKVLTWQLTSCDRGMPLEGGDEVCARPVVSNAGKMGGKPARGDGIPML